jgi:hypothetical protein
MCEENARIASVDTWWVISITGDSQLKLQLLSTKVSENLTWKYCTSDGWVERSQADRNSPHKSTRDILSVTRKFFHPSPYRNITCCQGKAWSFLCPWKQHSTEMIIGSHPIFHLQEYAKWVYSTFKMARKKIAGLNSLKSLKKFQLYNVLQHWHYNVFIHVNTDSKKYLRDFPE